jgi:hypothetical protein
LRQGESSRSGETPVFRLDVNALEMKRLDVGGEAPGWIFKHRSVAVSPSRIRVWAGTVIKNNGEKEVSEENLATFVLDIDRLRWQRE